MYGRTRLTGSVPRGCRTRQCFTASLERYPAAGYFITATMAALAVFAVTAAHAKTHTAAPPLPVDPNQQPTKQPGLIPLTVAEIKRPLQPDQRPIQRIGHHLHWSWWRRRHQARAKWFHHRARLRRELHT
jgi:hypothetical protein